MEEQNIVSPPPPVIEESQSETFYKKPKIIGLFALILALILGGGALAAISINKQKNNTDEKNQQQEDKFIADRTIVYGYWTGESSVIEAADLATGKTNIVSILPNNIKHVVSASTDLIYYIAETDILDHGSKIIRSNLETKQEEIVVVADDGYGIDDYKLSPNGMYMAVWMVQPRENAQILVGGKSRVYVLNTQDGSKNLIYDENISGVPINYPIGITNSGQLISDKFLPNSGAGWAYGMSTSNFDGTVKSPISAMPNGTYGSQPVLSDDGNYLGFAGYEGADGTVEVNGFRKAIVGANTFEIYDLVSKTREKIDTGIPSAIYSSISFDNLSNNYIVNAIYKDGQEVSNQQFAYDPSSKILIKLPAPQSNNSQSNLVVNMVDQNNFFIVDKVLGESNLGNLGPSYSQTINKISYYDARNQKGADINISQSPFQLIDIKSGKYFSSLIEKGILSYSREQLQLETFVLKPTLAPAREDQQNERPPSRIVPRDPSPGPEPPACKDTAYPKCNALLGTNYPVDKDLGDIGDPAFSSCAEKEFTSGNASGVCAGSPLYLYGEIGTTVNIEINTQTSNSNVDFFNNKISATLGQNSEIFVGNKSEKNISFDFRPAAKIIKSPKKGVTVKTSDAKSELLKISRDFGFNQRETSDLLGFINDIDSPYVYISFFDDSSSKSLLPISFDPIPDSYRSVIFYFKKVDAKPMEKGNLPSIEKISRKGLTAIEISYIVE